MLDVGLGSEYASESQAVLPAGIYLLKVSNRNTRETREKRVFKVKTKDTRTTPTASFWCLYC